VLPALAEFWDGPEELRASTQQKPFLHLWHNVLEEGNEVELGGEALPVRPGSSSDQAPPALDRVIAFAIEVRNRTVGVLMAGLLPSEDSVDDMARLESHALLASAALDQENARMERAEWSESLQRIVEESSEYLVFVDEEGRVCESSRAARAFLHLGSGHTEEHGLRISSSRSRGKP
jgi:hypothetical protein